LKRPVGVSQNDSFTPSVEDVLKELLKMFYSCAFSGFGHLDVLPFALTQPFFFSDREELEKNCLG